MENYKPIDCNYYDLLEHFATLAQPVAIRYQAPDAGEQLKTAVIKDLQARQGIEYMLLDDGTEFRLDWLISVNDQPLPGGSCAV